MTAPTNWRSSRLGQVGEIVSGSTPDTKTPEYWGGGIPWITPKDLSGYNAQVIRVGARSLTQAGYESCSTRLVPAGSVVFTSRAPIGYVAIAGNPLCTNQGFKTVIPGPNVCAEYLYWYLRYATPTIRSRASGTTFPEISARAFADVPIAIPPLDEQRRIVATIEERVTRIERSRGLIDASRRRARQYRNAILQRAVRGELRSVDRPPTTESRGQLLSNKSNGTYPLPVGWNWMRIGDLATVSSGSTPKAGDARYYVNGTIPWVTSGDLNDDYIRHPRQFVTDRAVADYRLKTLPAGTLLVAMYGEGRTRGKCSELEFTATTNQACAALTFSAETSIFRPWVKLFFAASYEANRRLASGGVQPNLSGRLVKSLLLPVPPVQTQAHILAEVDRQVAATDRLIAASEAAMLRSRALQMAILEAAFTGRLVSASASPDAMAVPAGSKS